MGHNCERQRPILWSFIRMIKDEEALIARSAREARRGLPPPARKAKYRKLEHQIQELKRKYTNGTKNLYDYWSALAHLICTFTSTFSRQVF
jgi:hypothetical protein